MFDSSELYLGTPVRLAVVHRSRFPRARTASWLLFAAILVVAFLPARLP
jgi:hypothetical protein